MKMIPIGLEEGLMKIADRPSSCESTTPVCEIEALSFVAL